MQKNLIWLIAAVILGAILVVSKSSRKNADPFFSRQQLQKRQWSDAKIVPFLTDGGVGRVVLSACEGKIAALPLSPVQRDALGQAVSGFAAVYASGKFEAYRNSRLHPVSAEHLLWNQKRMTEAGDMIEAAKKYPLPESLTDAFKDSRPDDNASLLGGYWELMRFATNAHLFRPAYCHACWTGMDTNSMLLEIKYSKAAGPAIKEFIGRNENIGSYHFAPMVGYIDISPQDTPPTLVMASMVVKTLLDESPYRIYVAFEWYGDGKAWLPVEFALGRSDLEVDYVF